MKENSSGATGQPHTSFGLLIENATCSSGLWVRRDRVPTPCPHLPSASFCTLQTDQEIIHGGGRLLAAQYNQCSVPPPNHTQSRRAIAHGKRPVHIPTRKNLQIGTFLQQMYVGAPRGRVPPGPEVWWDGCISISLAVPLRVFCGASGPVLDFALGAGLVVGYCIHRAHSAFCTPWGSGVRTAH